MFFKSNYRWFLLIVVFFIIPFFLIGVIHLGNLLYKQRGWNINPSDIYNKDWLTFLGIYITFCGTIYMSIIANNVSKQSLLFNQKIADTTKELERVKLKPILRLETLQFNVLEFGEFQENIGNANYFDFQIKPSSYPESTEYKTLCSFIYSLRNITENKISTISGEKFYIKLVSGSGHYFNEYFVLHRGPMSPQFMDNKNIRLFILVPNEEKYRILNTEMARNYSFVIDVQMNLIITNIHDMSYSNSINFFASIDRYHSNQTNDIDISRICVY